MRSPACAPIVPATSTFAASIRSAVKRPAAGCFTPAAVKRPIFTLTGGCAADSPEMSATVMVRLHRSKWTLPWVALAPLARTAAKVASTSLAICCCT